jgi:hypothetical protein
MSSRLRLLLVASLALVGGVFAMPGFSGATYTGTTSNTSTVTAASDWTPPTVSVTSPGATVSGTVTVSATAADVNSGIATVLLQSAPAGSSTWSDLCAARTATPYTCSWDTTKVADGGYQLRAIATDKAGYTATSAVVSTNVVNTAKVTLGTVADVVKSDVPLSATVTGYGSQTISSVKLEYALSGTTTYTQICAGTTANLSCSWATAAPTKTLNGEYDVRVTAVVGGKSYTDLVEGVVVDNTAPAGVVTSPTKNAVVSGTITLSADATDAHSGVDTVVIQYSPNGTTWSTTCTLTDSPYSCRFDTTKVADGSYSFRAVVTDLAGNNTTSAAVLGITVKNTASSVSIESPVGGSTVSGTVTVGANAAASTLGVKSVLLQYRPGTTGGWSNVCPAVTAAPYTCSWNTTGLNGSYQLQAVMTDNNNATLTSAPVAVTVDNNPLKGYDVQGANAGTAGKLEAGDTIALTYSGLVDLNTVKAGWNGSSTALAGQLVDGQSLGLTGNDDTLSFTGVNLGSVNLRAGYVNAKKTASVAATMVAGTTTVNGVRVTVVTITITSVPSGLMSSTTTAAAMRWTPSGSVRSPAGLACSTAVVTELGTIDRDF